MNHTAYCVKCKAKCDIVDPVVSTQRNGCPMVKGTCAVCGTRVCKILKKVTK
mgnify:CR=1 FL=1